MLSYLHLLCLAHSTASLNDSFPDFTLRLSNSVGSEGSDLCIHPRAMKQSPLGELAMDREQLRGCSQSLLMRHHELSPGFSLKSQYWAKNQVRQGNTHPTSQSQQFRGGLPTTSPHVDIHLLLWMAPLPTPLLVWMMHPCILLFHYPIGPVASPRCVACSS